MVERKQSPHLESKPFRKSLRLTFQVLRGEVKLVTHERLKMICPPSVGEIPEAEKQSGFWLELRDAKNKIIFHRLLHSPLGDSVEEHSPDGKIRRVFGEVKENIFEVLLPDITGAQSIVLMGRHLELEKTKKGRRTGSDELARFDVPKGEKGDER